MPKLLLLPLLLFAAFIAGTDAFWSACASGQPPNSVTSPSCSGASCTVVRGTTLTGSINFTPMHAVSQLTFYAFMNYLGQEVEIEVSEANRNACTSLTPACPTTPGTPVTWNLSLPIPTSLAAVSTQFTLELWYGISQMMCVNIQATVV